VGWVEVMASAQLERKATCNASEKSCESTTPLRLQCSGRNNDRCRLSCQSNPAHHGENSTPSASGSTRCRVQYPGAVSAQPGQGQSRQRAVSPQMLKLPPTFKTDVVRPALDREHPAQLLMVTTEENLKYPKQKFHKTYSRCRCLVYGKPASTVGRARYLEADNGRNLALSSVYTIPRRPVSRLKTSTTSATTSRRWIRPPPICRLNPRSHRIPRTTRIVQSIYAFFFTPRAPEATVLSGALAQLKHDYSFAALIACPLAPLTAFKNDSAEAGVATLPISTDRVETWLP